MASRRQLDASRCPWTGLPLIPLLLGWAMFLPAVQLTAQAGNADQQKIQELVRLERWQEIVDLVPGPVRSVEIDLAYGIALARLGRWKEAQTALQVGRGLEPHDPRFMIELAGVAFKQGDYPEAQVWMERARRITPQDPYDLEFLATVFYLEGNLEAALKYWNRVHKPFIQTVTADPNPRLDPVLLDRASVFSPATTLWLRDLWSSEARIAQLGVFSSFGYDLQARPQGDFALSFHSRERNGCGDRAWECLLLVLGETPGKIVNFDYFNAAGQAINFLSWFRWDSEKRRLLAQLDLPVENSPQWHLRVATDLRNENWAMRSSFSGPAPLRAALNLKRESFEAQFSHVLSWRELWSTSTAISHDSYHDVLPGNLLTSPLVSSGVQLKQAFSLKSQLLRRPERRFELSSLVSLAAARLWSNPSRDFVQLTASVALDWFPQPRFENYEIKHRIAVGKTFGEPPFSELFTLGVLGDTELHMAAHIGTRDGKKGSAPMGRNYLLSNWEATRNFRPLPTIELKLGPFVDTGKVSDPIPTFGSHEWLCDVGLEAKINAFGLGLVLSYGRDLRAGHNALVARSP